MCLNIFALFPVLSINVVDNIQFSCRVIDYKTWNNVVKNRYDGVILQSIDKVISCVWIEAKIEFWSLVKKVLINKQTRI